MAGPRQLWKTTIVVWTKEDPGRSSPVKLIAEPNTYWAGSKSELVSDPYKQEDGPEEDFFSEGE